MKRVIEVRSIGQLSARLVREGKDEYVELFVRLPSADARKLGSKKRQSKKPRRRKAAKKGRRS